MSDDVEIVEATVDTWTPEVTLPAKGLVRPELDKVTVQGFDPKLSDAELGSQMKDVMQIALESESSYESSLRQVVLSYGVSMIHCLNAGKWIAGLLNLPTERKAAFAKANGIQNAKGEAKLTQSTLGEHLGIPQSRVSRYKRAAEKVEFLYAGNVKAAIEYRQSIDSLSDGQGAKKKAEKVAATDKPPAAKKPEEPKDTDEGGDDTPPDPDPETPTDPDVTDSNAASHTEPKFLGLDDIMPEQWQMFMTGLIDKCDDEQALVDKFTGKLTEAKKSEKATTIASLHIWRRFRIVAEEFEAKCPKLLGLDS